ncbi:MAG TPA: class I SAM-dependent methyltransferase, partial [Firmicutes bacterium]|nr:class I SAM-dependent methyltransferase [Bacillota bacterium]
MFKSIAEYYSEIFPLKDEKLDFLRGLLPEDSGSILDIGCATGELALKLAGENVYVTGIDLDSEMIKFAQQNAVEGSAEFHVMDMTEILIYFRPQSFDGIICIGNTLPLLGDINLMESEVKAVSELLKPGGVFICQVVNFERIIRKK